MNPSKSSFQGQAFTISVSSDGEYRYYDRAVGVAGFTFRCDGKYRPMGKNRTEACVKSSATALDLIRKENGVKANAYHWELSSGGVEALRPMKIAVKGAPYDLPTLRDSERK